MAGTPRQPAKPADDHKAINQILAAYREGWFPMGQPDGQGAFESIEWVQPRRRAILPLDDRFHIPKSLAQRVRSRRFRITTDLAFEACIRSCSFVTRKAEDDEDPANLTWLAPEIMEAFLLLHAHGHAHSIEAWLPSSSDSITSMHTTTTLDGRPHVLVGGLYGLALGKAFCGESMFHHADLGGTDASKVCLVHLVRHLQARGFELLDAQLANDHTAQFGMYEMSREQYLAKLAALSTQSTPWTPFDSAR